MVPFNSEEYCISHLLSLNNLKYCVGLFKEELLVKGNWVICISKNENGVYERFEYNLKTKELKMSKKDNTESEFISVSNSIIESNCVIDISNYGKRWEGSCLNGSPFGYGSLFNSSNELIYQGVMIKDKKECFGIEFYPDLSQIEYIGCYWNNERHGFGMLYNRKGELMYEGDWLCGSSDYDKNVILKSINNDRIVHSLIHELVIAEGCGNDYEGDLILCGFVNLERIVMKKRSFQNVNTLVISDNLVLNSIEIEDGEWCGDNETGAFCNVKSVLIISTLIDDILI